MMGFERVDLNSPKDFEDFINLGVAWEKWLAGTHFRKDAANRPHINACRVLAATKQNLRSAIPQSDNLCAVSAYSHTARAISSHLMCIRPQWYAKRARKAKVCQLQVSVLINE